MGVVRKCAWVWSGNVHGCDQEIYSSNSNQKQVVSQLHFLKEAWSSTTSHESLPALHRVGPLIVGGGLKLVRVVLVVAEEVGLHHRLARHRGQEAHARDPGMHGCLMQGTICTVVPPGKERKEGSVDKSLEVSGGSLLYAAMKVLGHYHDTTLCIQYTIKMLSLSSQNVKLKFGPFCRGYPFRRHMPGGGICA